MKPLVIPETAQAEFHWKEPLLRSSTILFKSSSKATFKRKDTKGIISPPSPTTPFFNSEV